MIASESLLHDTVDLSKLDLLVCHPNGTSAKIEKIGNMNLSNSSTLFDVFAVPDFNVNLLSVHKVYKDSNCEVVFNEHNCKIQDLQSKVMVGNGRESGGLYYINSAPLGSLSNSSISSFVCCVSKLTWHNRLGHPSDQVLSSLRHRLKIGSEVLPPCDICHKAKQTRESFPVSQHTTSKLGELIHLDVWGPYKVTTTEGFRTPTSILNGSSPYELVYNSAPVFDKLRGYKVLSLDSNLIFVSRDVKFYESVFPFKLKTSSLTDSSVVTVNSNDLFSYDESLDSSFILDNTRADNLRSSQQMDGDNADQDQDETCPSNVSNRTGEAYVPPSDVLFPRSSALTEENDSINSNPSESLSTRITRSGRNVHMPVRFSDYVVEGTHKYGIERTVNYSGLNTESFCFISNLNKTVEPKTYSEAALDPN
ncbi:uncharacterized protein LOC128126829 [Lactuca sativa]|uniref:uncharacterized protein LOC128126829 n=1 Tax=Lactuca sativa TaxID=4236 RepID=UPI0022AEBCC1|nr:uncharacterized protein LOC128126829 [Lactuca sativa]